MSTGLSLSILDHTLADVYAYKRHHWISPSSIYRPTSNATTNIEHTAESGWICLFGEDTTHFCCNHSVLDSQASKLFLVFPILNHVGTRVIVDTSVKGSRHNLSFCLPLSSLFSLSITTF